MNSVSIKYSTIISKKKDNENYLKKLITLFKPDDNIVL